MSFGLLNRMLKEFLDKETFYYLRYHLTQTMSLCFSIKKNSSSLIKCECLKLESIIKDETQDAFALIPEDYKCTVCFILSKYQL